MGLAINEQGAALIKQLQKSTGMLSTQAEQALDAASKAQGATPLTAEQVQKVLVQAMPDKRQAIETAAQVSSGYHCDGKNPNFLTQILSIRVEKETAAIYSPPPAARPIRYDPYKVELNLDPKADVVLLFNARDVDRDGQPLLMKVVARERADMSKFDIARYRTKDPAPDVTRVANDADFVKVDEQEEIEFTFGDPLKQVSLNRKGEEISTSVAVRPVNQDTVKTYYGKNENGVVVPDLNNLAIAPQVNTGDGLDRQVVATFDDRVKLQLETTASFAANGWLDTPIAVGSDVNVDFAVDRGFMFEPGSKAEVSFLGHTLPLEVPPTDAHLLGSPSASTKVAYNGTTNLRNLLNATVDRNVYSTASDVSNKSDRAVSLIFANKADVLVGASALEPLADKTIARADFAANKVKVDKVPLANDPEEDGQKLRLALEAGFLHSQNGASVEGWKVVVGFTDHDGKWQQSDARAIKGKESSQALKFDFDLTNAAALHRTDAKLEVRLYNAQGVPAERLMIPLREVSWGPDAVDAHPA